MEKEINRDGHIVNVDINKEMKQSYIDYAMSVIVGRALPDVRDGLKPVHRRILYTMYEDGFTPSSPYKKCATTVGDVLGRYHPHGDASVYDALVRLAQDFSLRYPLVDGHGNFGSVDGDPPAAYRYTEARMSKISTEMLTDIEKETVDFVPNFDESTKEPDVLPSKFPNLLVNGSSGIAVGMATNVPPHNLREVVRACITLLDRPEATVEELMEDVKGPDFPTGGLIMGVRGIRKAYETGRGKVVVRARTEIEDDGKRQRIIVTEIPYQVNKTRLIESIATLVKNKVVDGIADLNDESGKEGMRIVIDLKRDANANVILNQLYKHTQLQDSCGIILLAIDKHKKPRIFNLKELLESYLEHQKEVIVRRTQFDLKKAQARAHILEGLKIALDNIDRVIDIIRGSANVGEARENLITEFDLSMEQAQAIVDMRLARLTGLEREKIEEELAELMEKIAYYQKVLSDESMVASIVREEMQQVAERYGDERRTEITFGESDLDIEDLIPEEDTVVTLTQFGYVKRMAVDAYRTQHRGGRGISGMNTREEDFATEIFVASTHDFILFFTNQGRMYKIKTYKIPETGRQARGTALVNLLELGPDEKVTACIPMSQFEEGKYLLMLTKNGVVKKTELQKYDSYYRGLNAITLDEGDELIRVKKTDGTAEVIIGTHQGKAIRFSEADVRAVGRSARGVRAMKLAEGDYAVGMAMANDNMELLTVTEKGLGKKTPISAYRKQARGGSGIKNYMITEKTGNVVGIKTVSDETDDLILMTEGGVIIRIHIDEIRSCGRVSQGVRLIRAEDDTVAAIAKIGRDDEDGGEAEALPEMQPDEEPQDFTAEAEAEEAAEEEAQTPDGE